MPSLTAGGAERVMSFIAQNLDPNKFRVTLLITGYQKDTSYNTGGIRTVYLNEPRVSKSIFKIYRFLKLENPKLVFSSIFHLNTLLAFISLLFPKMRFIGRESSVLSVLKQYNSHKKFYFPKKLTVIAYKLVDCIVCQSKDMKEDMINNYGVSRSKTALINNPLTSIIKLKEEEEINNKKHIRFITIGRLSKEKGYDRIIKALGTLSFDFEYTIIGDGEERETILKLIENQKISEKTNHIPYTNNVGAYLRKSDLFLQGSYVDGFPNALLESCMAGTPILAYNAPGGLNEIVENGVNGYIVQNDEEFIEQLNRAHKELPFSPEKVQSVVNKRFNASNIIKDYENLFLKISMT